MNLAFRILPLAERELGDAIIWYESARVGLGADFLLCLDEAIARILAAPAAYPIACESVRVVQMHRFPYRVHYRIKPGLVEIMAVYHTNRRPIDWQERS